jgi:hypothetical protein
MNIEFNEKAYQEYVKNREYPSNTRIRSMDMSFVDVIIKGQEIMESTEEGKETLEYINSFGIKNGE